MDAQDVDRSCWKVKNNVDEYYCERTTIKRTVVPELSVSGQKSRRQSLNILYIDDVTFGSSD